MIKIDHTRTALHVIMLILNIASLTGSFFVIIIICHEPRSHEFLIQRVAVAIQRGNAASVLGATVAG